MQTPVYILFITRRFFIKICIEINTITQWKVIAKVCHKYDDQMSGLMKYFLSIQAFGQHMKYYFILTISIGTLNICYNFFSM